MAKIYECINKVQRDLSKVGISKDNTNTQQNFKFRSIDAFYNTLAPLLATHGLCILPRVLKREVREHTTSKGTVLFYSLVKVEYTLVCSEDASKHVISVYGEAMDSGDKGTNKAMSAAYKYACIQAFCIPTEGDNDADANTPEEIVKSAPAKKEPVKAEAPKLDPTSTDWFEVLKEYCNDNKITGTQAMEWTKKYGVDKLSQLTDVQVKEIIGVK